MKKSGFAKGVIWTISITLVCVIILATVGIVAYNGYEKAALTYSSGESETKITLEKKKKNSEPAKVSETESTQTIEKETIPEWFVKPPQGSDTLLYVRGTAVSDQLQFSLDLATNAALKELGKKIETRLASKSKVIIRQAGIGEDQVSKTEINLISSTVVNEVTISGYEIVNTHIVPLDNGRYRSYILLEYPLAEVYKVFISRVEKEIAGKIETKTNNDRVALIFGIEKYNNLPKAEFANQDAKNFYNYAIKVFGVKKDKIKILTDNDATRRKTFTVIKNWLSSRLKANQSDLIIYFAGHGLADLNDQENYLLFYDSYPNLLSKTAISLTDLFNSIDKLNPRSVTIFLDTSFGGFTKFEKLAKFMITSDGVKSPKNFTIFYASQFDQIASSLRKQKQGIFSYFLMKGLEGEADLNNDKQITNGELLDYMDQNISQKALALGKKQNPMLEGNPNKVLINNQTTDIVNIKTDEKYYALIIGNNNYQHLEKLDAAENDARVLANILKKKYGFEVELLLNGDYDNTVNSIFKMTKKLKKDDNLLIYYAGHGQLDRAENRGYWLPIDASYELRSRWISNSTIVDRVKATKAKHVLLMVDSCFSGLLMRSGEAAPSVETMDAKYIERLKNKKTRLVITSGGNEPVVDSDGGQHSLFALKLIDTLKNNNTVINSQILFENIRRYVVSNADQTPERAMVHKTGHDGGDFLFFAKN